MLKALGVNTVLHIWLSGNDNPRVNTSLSRGPFQHGGFECTPEYSSAFLENRMTPRRAARRLTKTTSTNHALDFPRTRLLEATWKNPGDKIMSTLGRFRQCDSNLSLHV